MIGTEVCPECRVPHYITREHAWLDSGVIVQRSNPTHRLTILDTHNLDPLYQRISELIGVPIERIVTETARRTTRGYMDKAIPEEMKGAACSSHETLMSLVELSFRVGKLLGCGKPSLQELRIKNEPDDFVAIRVEDPYSVPLYFGNFAGTAEVVLGRDSGVTYRELSPGVYEGTVFPSDHPEEMHERLQSIPYDYRSGDIDLVRCHTCGGPWGLADYRWDTECGKILSRSSAARVAILGPQMLHPIFEELEKELGEAIPHLVVEAQRRDIRAGELPRWFAQEDTLRTVLALRGFGNLQEFSMTKRGLKLSLADACLPLRVTGWMQGLFELSNGTDSRVLWEEKETRLEIEIEAY